MTSHFNPKYLPHRRQRPLADNAFEFKTLFSSGAKQSSRLDPVISGVVAGVAFVTAISTLALGASFLSDVYQSQNAQVAGLRTEIPYDDPEPAATTQPTVVCWNQVRVNQENNLVWRDSCRGLPPRPTQNCLDEPFELTRGESRAYRDWFYGNKTLDSSCQAQPGEIPRRIPTEGRFR